MDRIKDKWAYGYRFVLSCGIRFLYSVWRFSPRFLVAYVKGNIAARNFVKSKEYLSLPKFVLSTDE